MAQDHSCSNCQEAVKSDWQLCPHCGQPNPATPGLIRCRVCGRSAAGALRTCPNCGAYLESKPWPILQFSLGAVILLGVFFGFWQMGPSLQNRLEEIALLVTPPTATSSPTAKPTPTATFTPTSTSTSTATAIPTSTFTPSPTTTPTRTPTPQPTDTSAVVAAVAPTDTPTVTPTPAPKYGQPVLVGPEDGKIFVRDAELVLQWKEMGPLADNEWYAVRLTWLQDGQLAFGGDNIKQNSWIVPPDLYWGLADQSTGRKYEWFVFIEAIVTDKNGQQVTQPVSEVSDRAGFLWQ